MNVETLLRGLNAAQAQAVQTTEGPLLVLAGAGTGKTRVITYRIAYLLARGVPAKQILAVTFTRKAAAEMRERIEALLGGMARNMTIATFHSVGLRILREHAEEVGLRSGFRVFGTTEQNALIRELLRQTEEDNPRDSSKVLARLSLAKNRGHWSGNGFYQRYQKALRKQNAVDFDDLVLLPVELLENSPELRSAYQRRWRYLLIDEYQDTNDTQVRLTRCLVGPEEKICVVGDDDQSIYGFRGANVEKILSFERDFPAARVVKLEENYRCTPQIITVANAVIERAAKRYPKRLRAQRDPGPPTEWRVTRDEDSETHFIAEQIQRLSSDEAVSYSDLAILVRIGKHAAMLRRELRKKQIPCDVAREEGASTNGGVTLMTLHASKGLEFPVVFLPGLEEETLPHWHAIREGTVEEERRLLYVGITRAQRRLFLSSSLRRRENPRQPTRFLRELGRTEIFVRRYPWSYQIRDWLRQPFR